MVQPLWNTVCPFLKKLHINLQDNPAISLLGIYQRNENICTHKGMYTNVRGTIIHKVKNQKHSKWPPTDEWVNKTWYVHTMEYSGNWKG